MKIYNHTHQKQLRQNLRKNLTTPEQLPWSKIRSRQLGVKFRRQFGIGKYIAGFYSPELRFVIEIDGDSHFESDSRKYDQQRNRYFESLNIEVQRYSNLQVMREIDGVLFDICGHIQRLKVES